MTDLSVDNVATGFRYLEPLHIANTSPTLIQRVLNGIFNACL